jgi:hypothetical protein
MLDAELLTAVVETIEAVVMEETELLELDAAVELEVTMVVTGAVVVVCPAVGTLETEAILRSIMPMSMRILRGLSILTAVS